MISKEDFRKALGTKVGSMSEEEIEKTRVGMDKLANILFDIWNDDVKILNEEKTDSTT